MSRYHESTEEMVEFVCSVCGKSEVIWGRSMKRIAYDFEYRGWGNHAVDREGKTEWVVFCKQHNSADRLALLYAE